MDPIRVTVRRGGVVEATHRVHVAGTDGESWGDPELTFFFRSSAKPIQAIPFVDGYAVPTFAATLADCAELLTRTPQRIRAAMRARPELVGGSRNAVDTDLMRLRDGWIAKGGAE